MILVNLFLTFTKISFFAVGGAYSFLPLLEKELVQKYHWMDKGEFLDILAVVKIFPGAISIKYATYTGYKMKGVLGAIVANMGNLLGPVILTLFAFLLYSKYKNVPGVKGAFNMIQLSVFAMIIAIAFQLIDVNQLVQLKSLSVITISFILFIYTKIDPAFIIVGAGIVGAILR